MACWQAYVILEPSSHSPLLSPDTTTCISVVRYTQFGGAESTLVPNCTDHLL